MFIKEQTQGVMIHLAIVKEIKYNYLTKMLLINDAGNSILKKQIHYLDFRFKSRRVSIK